MSAEVANNTSPLSTQTSKVEFLCWQHRDVCQHSRPSLPWIFVSRMYPQEQTYTRMHTPPQSPSPQQGFCTVTVASKTAIHKSTAMNTPAVTTRHACRGAMIAQAQEPAHPAHASRANQADPLPPPTLHPQQDPCPMTSQTCLSKGYNYSRNTVHGQ